MKLQCLQCGHEYDGWITKDGLGWCSLCPECGGSFDVDIPEGKIIMAFAWDEDDDYFTDNWRDDNHFATYYAFNTQHEFFEAWEKMSENPDGMWYWVMVDGKCICSGACDPGDIEIFNEYFNNISIHDYPDEDEYGEIKIRHWAIDILTQFEELLDKHGIKIPDTDRTGSDDEACIYGTTYGNLEQTITEILLEFAVEVRDHIDYELDHYFL